MRSRHLLIVGALISLLVLASGVSATTLIATSSTRFYCDAVVFNYDSSGFPTLYLQVTDTSNNPLGPAKAVPTSGTYRQVLDVDPPQPEGTTLKIRYSSDGTNYYDVFGAEGTGECSGLRDPNDEGPNTPPPPPYEIMGGVNARARMFVVEEANGPDNPALVFYQIDEAGVGGFQFYISKKELAELPDMPDEPVLIYSSPDGKLAFYKLTSGEYQINVGPDAEGKTHVVVFTGVPPENVYSFTFSSLALNWRRWSLTTLS